MAWAKVYIVKGAAGLRDWVFQDWNVRALFKKDVANAMCDRLNKWCVENGCHERDNKGTKEKPPEDPSFPTTMSFYGVRYSVEEIDLCFDGKDVRMLDYELLD